MTFLQKNSEPRARILTRGMWGQNWKAQNVLCSDGIRRTARIGEANTFFTIPASVQVKGKTVTGFISAAPSYASGDERDLWFHAYTGGKNGALLAGTHQETLDHERLWKVERGLSNYQWPLIRERIVLRQGSEISHALMEKLGWDTERREHAPLRKMVTYGWCGI